MQQCRFCSLSLPDDAQFCPRCGRSISESTAALASDAQTQSDQSEEESTQTLKLGPLEAKQLAVLHKMMRSVPSPQQQAHPATDEDDDLPPPIAPDDAQGAAPVVQNLPQTNVAPEVPSFFMFPNGSGVSGGLWAGMPVLMKIIVVSVLGVVILGAAAGVVWRFFLLTGTTPTTVRAGTPSVNVAPTQTAMVQARKDTSISVRDNQLWITTNGQSLPLTSFTYNAPEGFSDTKPTIYWSTPTWSPDNKYLAFIMSNLGTALGGAGCPAPNYDYGALYLLDPTSKQLFQITTQGSVPVALNANIGNQAIWRAFFWEDATHVLLIPNYDARNAPGDKANLYRYDLQEHTISSVFPLTQQALLGAAAGSDKFNLLTYRYRNGQFYYQIVENVGQDTAQIGIYSRALAQGSQPKKVTTVSTPLPWCKPADDQAHLVHYVAPGWDISPDGKYLAFQKVSGVGEQSKSSVLALDLATGQQSELFSQLPQNARTTDLGLNWAPDNHTLLASYASYDEEQAFYYVTSLEKPDDLKTHTHPMPRDDSEFCYAGSWRPDSGEIAFTCQKSQKRWNAYAFTPGNQEERLLAENTSIYTWG
jgi:hypothetical protein